MWNLRPIRKFIQVVFNRFLGFVSDSKLFVKVHLKHKCNVFYIPLREENCCFYNHSRLNQCKEKLMQEKAYKILCLVVMEMTFNFHPTFNTTFKFPNKPIKYIRLWDKWIIIEHHASDIEKTISSKENSFITW